MQRTWARRQFGTPYGWIAFADGSAGKYVCHGMFAGSDAPAGIANRHAAIAAIAEAPLPMPKIMPGYRAGHAQRRPIERRNCAGLPGSAVRDRVLGWQRASTYERRRTDVPARI